MAHLVDEITPEEMMANVRRTYELASPEERLSGATWYIEANLFCKNLAEETNLSLETVAGITAVMSPRVEWGLNKRMATKFCHGEPVGGLPESMRKAQAILDGEPFETVHKGKAYKVRSFYGCIVDPWSDLFVVIDRHAAAVACGTHQLSDNVMSGFDAKGRYGKMAEAYRQAAEAEGVLPLVAQAVTWEAHKRLKKGMYAA